MPAEPSCWLLSPPGLRPPSCAPRRDKRVGTSLPKAGRRRGLSEAKFFLVVDDAMLIASRSDERLHAMRRDRDEEAAPAAFSSARPKNGRAECARIDDLDPMKVIARLDLAFSNPWKTAPEKFQPLEESARVFPIIGRSSSMLRETGQSEIPPSFRALQGLQPSCNGSAKVRSERAVRFSEKWSIHVPYCPSEKECSL